jgi:hypothetical protein
MSGSILGSLIMGDSPNNGQLPATDKPAQKADVESHRGRFFAIDSRIWAKVTAYGMNEAVAYLVLACGTGHSNRSTSWSTNAVMTHAGMGWDRAKHAIERLKAGRYYRCADSHTTAHPRYEKATYRELVEYETAKNPPEKPDRWEQEVLSAIQAGKQPSNKPDRNRADQLYLRGLLCRDAAGIYKLPEPLTEDSGENLIWLPNEIVTGTSRDEESPVKRLRSAGCVWTLRLFVDLYAAQNLRDDGGISPHVVRLRFDRCEIGQQGAYTVWAFKETGKFLWWTGPLAAHQKRAKAKPDADHPIWGSLDLLQRLRLLDFVPHIFENDTDTAEPIHAFGRCGTGEVDLEFEIGSAADEAAWAMALPSRLSAARKEGFEYFCPIRNNKPAAQMIGVARLRYRPHTSRTAAWFAELQKTAPVWIETYKSLTAIGKSAALRRQAKCA